MEKHQKPVGKLRQRQKAETYAAILDSARSLFDELGFDKTTIRAVAVKAEIGLGTIYKYFSQKNALLAAAFYDDLDSIIQKSFKSLPDTLSMKDTLLYIAHQFYDFYSQSPSLSKTYITQIFQLDNMWLGKILQLDDIYLAGIAALLDKAKLNGEVSETVDSFQAAKAFHANYLYVLHIHVAIDTVQVESMIQTLEDLIDIMMEGILRREVQT